MCKPYIPSAEDDAGWKLLLPQGDFTRCCQVPWDYSHADLSTQILQKLSSESRMSCKGAEWTKKYDTTTPWWAWAPNSATSKNMKKKGEKGGGGVCTILASAFLLHRCRPYKWTLSTVIWSMHLMCMEDFLTQHIWTMELKWPLNWTPLLATTRIKGTYPAGKVVEKFLESAKGWYRHIFVSPFVYFMHQSCKPLIKIEANDQSINQLAKISK